MRDLSYLWVFVGFAVIADIVFLIWGRRSKQKDAAPAETDRPAQFAIPFTERREQERRGSGQTHATAR